MDLDIHIHFSHEKWLKDPMGCCQWSIFEQNNPNNRALSQETALKVVVITEDFVRVLNERINAMAPRGPRGVSRYDLAKR